METNIKQSGATWVAVSEDHGDSLHYSKALRFCCLKQVCLPLVLVAHLFPIYKNYSSINIMSHIWEKNQLLAFCMILSHERLRQFIRSWFKVQFFWLPIRYWFTFGKSDNKRERINISISTAVHSNNRHLIGIASKIFRLVTTTLGKEGHIYPKIFFLHSRYHKRYCCWPRW